ncbi:MAG: glycosyltransferase family 2 protein [Bacteriovoracaceae bacterium]|nr:glycosyltransferase family 2 protein [Bacteriovoracaceae bacterium]
MNLMLILLLGILFYIYVGYFFLCLILGKIFKRKITQSDITPSVSLLIAAYNEESSIEAKILNSLELDYPKDKLEIIVVSDGSTDRTDEIVNRFLSRGVRLVRVEGRVGKTQARNVAVNLANGEIILFSDATTKYDPKIIRKMVRNFADPQVGMVTSQLIYFANKNSSMGLGQKLFWKYESLLKKAQNQMGTLTGTVGCATSFRKKFYTPLPSNIIEDFTEPLMFILKGFRVVYEEEAICYEEVTDKTKQELKMRVRVIRGGMTGLLYAKKILNPFMYLVPSFQLISHKVLRWLAPIIGLSLLFVSISAVIFESSNIFASLILLLQLLFYLCALVSYIVEKRGKTLSKISIPHYFVILNIASLVALFKTATSKLEATWETQR